MKNTLLFIISINFILYQHYCNGMNWSRSKGQQLAKLLSSGREKTKKEKISSFDEKFSKIEEVTKKEEISFDERFSKIKELSTDESLRFKFLCSLSEAFQSTSDDERNKILDYLNELTEEKSSEWENKLKFENLQWAQKIAQRQSTPVGVAMAKGGHDYQEDWLEYRLPSQENPNYAFFGVFDGHGAKPSKNKIPQFLGSNLFANIMNEEQFKAGVEESNEEFIKKGITQGFLTTDNQIKEKLESHDRGSTAIVALLVWLDKKRKIFIANTGDSVAKEKLVNKSSISQISTLEHNCKANKKEITRIEAMGGFIINNKVNGILEVTRAFGHHDSELKEWVICEPEITDHECTNDHELLMLGTDGVFDPHFLTTQKQNTALLEVMKQKLSPMHYATKLVDSADGDYIMGDNKGAIALDPREIFYQMEAFQPSKDEIE